MKSNLKRAFDITRREGPAVLVSRLAGRVCASLGLSFKGNFDRGYARWLARRGGTAVGDETRQRLSSGTGQPQFSVIVPVHNVDPQWLDTAVGSVVGQSYPHWQLCLVDDGSDGEEISACLEKWCSSDTRIISRRLEPGLGISGASNAALEMATGNWVVLLDHDDELDPNALSLAAGEILEHPNVDLIYSDEDKVDTRGKRHTPFFKPDFSPELLLCQNYIGHLVVVRRELVEAVGGFRSQYDGAQDYDLLLRLVSRTARVRHIPQILYHWRDIPGSTASNLQAKDWADDAGLQALQNFMESNGLDAVVSPGNSPGTYVPKLRVIGDPMVSVVIPFRDRGDLLDACIRSVLDKSGWDNLEILAINNSSSEPETAAIVEEWQYSDAPVRFLTYDEPFNFSAICNFGISHCDGDYVVLLNNDIEIAADNWIEKMLGIAQLPGVGAVGGKLLYPDGTIQHAGIVIGIDGGAGHPFKGFPAKHRGYFLRLELLCNVSAVTAAMLMVARDRYLEVGGLDEDLFGVAYNDVDFCLKLTDQGYRNVVVPSCTAIHHESATRGYENSRDQKQRHDLEKQQLKEKWAELFSRGDPYYNPNLTLAREDYSLNFSKDGGHG